MSAFHFDPDRCTGCEACRIACGIENGAGRDTGWRQLLTFNPERLPSLPTRHLTIACNHCQVPACANGCPANAYHRDEATGAMLIDRAKCIGCRYCSWLCPYDAPQFDSGEGVMTKCTFCAPRQAEGREPACTQACPTTALTVGPRGEYDPDYLNVGPTGLRPALNIRAPRLATSPVTYPQPEIPSDWVPRRRAADPKISPRSEWALLLFTIVMPVLVAWFIAGLALPARAPSPALFLALGVAALLATTLHLGKPSRFWRAMLNVRRSWLSREVVSAGIFLPLASLTLFLPLSPIVSMIAAFAGILLVVSIDGVYRAIPRNGRLLLHSSEAILTLLMLVAIATGSPLVAWSVAALKGVTFIARRGTRTAMLSATRLILLLGASLLMWPAGFVLAIAGELIDRALFYDELEPTTPASRLQPAD